MATQDKTRTYYYKFRLEHNTEIELFYCYRR